MLNKHQKVEKNSILMLILVVIVVSIGGIIEILPLFRMETTIEPVKGVRPYTPLEIAGQNVYIREGCYNCHSQQIRPLRDEVERYGHYSLAAESMYDHPFQWGSKRTGPDLARVGGKYSDDWHVQHMIKPQQVVPESIMPAYAHLAHKVAKLEGIGSDMKALKMAGVPYTEEMIENAYNDAMAQAQGESDHHDGLIERYGEKVNYRNFDGQPITTELDALIAYLQVLGTMAELKDYVHDGEARSSHGEGGK
ncbi:cytochrome-c oxidase, cbb3-type subunit II [Kordiimonas gwangyangensis]|uniref:cytochrome-c oxidase, cbb3-type subunit II n=1 Tax=Kordiimonas gwangyangensis TaxID=288022 RepID=UPI000365F8C9|nr:cytochrome-c oxidase, cbb3-type subunit II [Kordiimonas gwangyangensis]